MNDIFNDNVSLKTETPAIAKHVLPAVPSSEVYLEDCVTALKRYADNHFDLAIVDPPYGIGEDGRKSKGRTTRTDGSIRNGIDKRNGATIFRKTADYSTKNWDEKAPDEEYFNELIRVSKNQIIFGANHFIEKIPKANSSGWIVWNKVNGCSDFSDCELAWTSFNKGVRKVDFMWNGMLQGSEANGLISEGNKSKCEKRIHPTQKPKYIYKWILNNYASDGNLILDTHLGSGSSRIACWEMKFDFTGFEIDTEYYEKQEKRFNDFKSQLRMF